MVQIGARVFVFLPDDDVFSPNVVGTVTEPPDEHGRYMVRADGGNVYQCTAKMIRVLSEPDDVLATIAWHLGQIKARAVDDIRISVMEAFMHVNCVLEEEGIDSDRILDLTLERMDAANKHGAKVGEVPSE